MFNQFSCCEILKKDLLQMLFSNDNTRCFINPSIYLETIPFNENLERQKSRVYRGTNAYCLNEMVSKIPLYHFKFSFPVAGVSRH